jgi:hypothetical protein
MNAPNYRMERISRLLKELEYEIRRGMMEGEVDESLVYRFFVPISKAIPNGVVHCEFSTRPRTRQYLSGEDLEPRLRVVK